MKKLIQKIKSKFNNTGSSVILVVVALGFIGILIGSLLSAVGYVYRLKLYDYNARDNFYYVEQAMDEIYAGIGSQTNQYMQDAYTYTVDNMVRFDLAQNAYVNIGNEAANKMFKDTFMNNLSTSSFFGINLPTELEKLISNSTVKLDKAGLRVQRVQDADGNLEKIIIKDVTLTRQADYERSKANGQFTQTISADIVISRPDFTVDFNNVNTEYTEILNFALIADSGVEVNQPASAPLAINGNIYAAADYYNKGYNNYDGSAVTNYDKASYTVTVVGASDSISVNLGSVTGDKSTYVDPSNENRITYNFNLGKVSSKAYDASDVDANTLYNLGAYQQTSQKLPYDGVTLNSRYSGFYINGSEVSILADKVIVPGTIAVMNSASLSLYGKSGKQLSSASVWTDNLILGGYSRKKVGVNPGTGTTAADVVGASANIRADMYVRDDMEINADGANFALLGTYYGYGDSTTKDSRTFVPTVNVENFQYEAPNGTAENRGHYNSSAILINGEHSNLDLSKTTTFFLAGRSYIELSKKTTELQDSTDPEVKTETYAFDSSINDFKTGESLSVQPNQLAYIPVTMVGTEPTLTSAGYYEAELPETLKGSTLFLNYFGNSGKVPCMKITASGKDNYFYDFSAAYDNAMAQPAASRPVAISKYSITSADEFAEAFILDYCAELNERHSAIKDYLVDIRKYEDFEAGNIIVPDTTLNTVYSSGAITAKSDTEFTITSEKGTDIRGTLLAPQVAAFQATEFSKDCEKHYAYMKWALMDLEENAPEAKFVDQLVADAQRGESAITPINRYMNFDKIGETTNVHKNLSSGYDVWVTYNDIVVSDDDGDGEVRGMIITKGDVIFPDNITKFEGLIVSGGKIYFNGNVQSVSANSEICKTILSECQLLGDDQAKYIVSLFKSYENITFTPGGSADTGVKDINTIDYSDVVRYDNWMKNVK